MDIALFIIIHHLLRIQHIIIDLQGKNVIMRLEHKLYILLYSQIPIIKISLR